MFGGRLKQGQDTTPSRNIIPFSEGTMEITVIDDREIVGWTAAATRIGEIYMTNVASMVQNVITKAAGTPISRLNIVDHGNAVRFQIGSDHISLGNLATYRSQLVRLNGQFRSNGFVHLQHCAIGNNQPLLLQLSSIWGVPVYAGTGNHNSIYRFNLGEYVRCQPLPYGCTTDVRRPSAP